MTTPRLVEALSSPTTLQIGSQPTQICPAINESVIVYNNDLTNIAYVGYTAGSGLGTTNTVPVQPLTQVVLNARRGLYAFCPTASISVTIVPGGTYISPSPAQIAAQIAASGVFSLGNSTLQYFPGFNIPVVVGTPLNSGSIPTNGTGYDFAIFPSSTANAFFKVEFAWFAGGTLVADQVWWILPGIANSHQIIGTGPSAGTTLQIIMTAFVANIGITVAFFNNSRNYTRHDWRSVSWSTSNVAGTIQPNDAPSLMLFQLPNTSFNAGVTNTYLLPLFAGRVRAFGQTTSATTDMTVACNNLADQTSTGNNPFWKGRSDATGTINQEFSLPRSQSDFTITNQNAAAKSLEMALIAEEY